MNLSEALIWTVILTVGIGTFFLRYSFIILLGRIREPEWLGGVLKFVPPAVMAALVSSSLVIREGSISIDGSNQRLMAGVLAALVAWKSRSLFWTIVSGMLFLHFFRAVL